MSSASNENDVLKEPGNGAAPDDAAEVTNAASAVEADPGAEADEADEVPSVDPSEEKPMLRPLEAFPVDGAGGQKLLALYDPSGIAPQPVTLPPLGAAVIDLCDGTRNRKEILAEFAARYRRTLTADALEALLKKLDDALLLDSTNFRLHCAKVFAEFSQSPTRPPLGAGTLYPAEKDAAEQALQAAFAPPNGPGLATPEQPGKPPRAVLLPSLEPKSAGPAFAWALKPLLDAAEFPTLIVLLGCDHGAADPLLTFTRKHYTTPLGSLHTDGALVDLIVADATAVNAELGELVVRDEFHHRNEHSLELLALWLQFVLEERKKRGLTDPEPKVLPILCGSLHDFASASGSRAHGAQDTRVMDEVVHLVQQRVGERQGQGERVLWLAAADLAHVGPRFGDPQAMTDEDRDSLERRDRQTLKPLLMGDAQTFLTEIKREHDRRHVVGLGTIYTFLQASRPTGGVLRCYAQCSVSPQSFISTASVVFP
jgi:predicted class III extradiol MEMO1 family dioxygenase